MTGNTVTTVNLDDVRVSLDAADSTNHALVLATSQGTLRIVGTVAAIRQAAQRGLGMPIPALPRATPGAASAPASDTEARLSRIEEALVGLNEIAQAARRRGLV